MVPNPPGETARRWHRLVSHYRRWDKAWSADPRKEHHPRIFVEGDSWFAYPRKYGIAGRPMNIIQQLASRHRRLILMFAESGDELGQMLRPINRQKMLDAVQEFHFDLFLFSGGGNDFVGPGVFGPYLKSGQPGDALSWIRQPKAHALFDRLKRDFSRFVREALESAKNPKMRLLTHTYDRVFPRNKGTSYLGNSFGPWMWPDLEAVGVPLDLRRTVALWFLDAWADRLKAVRQELPAALRPRFRVIDTRGTLGDNPKLWKDEIHPNRRGFELLADRFRVAGKPFLGKPRHQPRKRTK